VSFYPTKFPQGAMWQQCESEAIAQYVIWGLRRGLNEVFVLLGCTRCWLIVIYRRFDTTYRSSSRVKQELIDPWNGTDRLSRNVGNSLPNNAAWRPRRVKLQSLIFSTEFPSECEQKLCRTPWWICWEKTRTIYHTQRIERVRYWCIDTGLFISPWNILKIRKK